MNLISDTPIPTLTPDILTNIVASGGDPMDAILRGIPQDQLRDMRDIYLHNNQAVPEHLSRSILPNV